MILIEAGNAQLGAERDRIDQFVNRMKALDRDFNPSWPDVCMEGPQVVFVNTFWIDRYEVTNQQYLRFVEATHRAPPRTWPNGKPVPGTLDHPVVRISRADAEAYAHSLGKELPTVAQWMRAFHRHEPILFPWGDEWEPGWTNTSENKSNLNPIWPVGDSPRDKSWCGVRNLVGNASELTRDTLVFNDRLSAIVKGSAGNQPGRVTGLCAHRMIIPVDETGDTIGFRCVYEPKPPQLH
jgi:formylglycine-generating enzyme required for sulfatase activity